MGSGSRGKRHRVRACLVVALALALNFLVIASGWASGVATPPSVQASLAAKLANYDEGFAARAGSVAHVVVVSRKGDAASVRTATAFREAIRNAPTVGGLPHEEVDLVYSTPAALVDAVRRHRAAMVYFSEGFEDLGEEIGTALDGVNVLSLAAEVGAVEKGIVVGFDLVSGQTKLLVNLHQAEKQGVRLSTDLLRLAVIVKRGR